MKTKNSNVDAATINYQFTAIPTNFIYLMDNDCFKLFAILLQKETYWNNKGMLKDGYFIKSISELAEELNLKNRKDVHTIIEALHRKNIISIQVQPRKYNTAKFKLNWNIINEYLNKSIYDLMEFEERIVKLNRNETITYTDNVTSNVTDNVTNYVTNNDTKCNTTINNINKIDNKENINNIDNIYNNININKIDNIIKEKENNFINKITKEKERNIEFIPTTLEEDNNIQTPLDAPFVEDIEEDIINVVPMFVEDIEEEIENNNIPTPLDAPLDLKVNETKIEIMETQHNESDPWGLFKPKTLFKFNPNHLNVSWYYTHLITYFKDCKNEEVKTINLKDEVFKQYKNDYADVLVNLNSVSFPAFILFCMDLEEFGIINKYNETISAIMASNKAFSESFAA